MTRPRPLHTRIAIAAIVIEASAAVAWLGARAARFLARSWSHRVAVVGASMAPTLLPGDWLLADPDAYRRAAAAALASSSWCPTRGSQAACS